MLKDGEVVVKDGEIVDRRLRAAPISRCQTTTAASTRRMDRLFYEAMGYKAKTFMLSDDEIRRRRRARCIAR